MKKTEQIVPELWIPETEEELDALAMEVSKQLRKTYKVM